MRAQSRSDSQTSAVELGMEPRLPESYSSAQSIRVESLRSGRGPVKAKGLGLSSHFGASRNSAQHQMSRDRFSASINHS